MARKKTPQLRPGLTVDEVLEGTWMVASDRYVSEDELFVLTDRLLREAVQGLIDEADSGGRVTRRTVINTLSGLSTLLMNAKDHIREKMSSGELDPTVLDEIANV